MVLARHVRPFLAAAIALLEHDGFWSNRYEQGSIHLAPLAGRGRIASAMRSIVRCNPGEGESPRVRACRKSPSPQPSKSELRSSRPREGRGAGEVIDRRRWFNLKLIPS